MKIKLRDYRCFFTDKLTVANNDYNNDKIFLI